uniref:Poly [ADP-ribose] polymerase n=1 Tax=Panagrolaimus superbus TaxID=310955 RepID=A0A914YRV5_9BILA
MISDLDLYIRNSAQNVKVTGIYSILSKAGVEFFDEKGRKGKNHKYLWHGTRPENLLSILKLGLLATPPHAIQTGNLFGEGIYFAETFVKSYNYCTESSKGQKYALLCEVAIGSVFTSASLYDLQTTTSADAKNKDTLKIAGKNIPNDKFEVTAPTGVRLPLGEMQRNETLDTNWGAMEYSEYIVKDRSNVIIRYLVSFE